MPSSQQRRAGLPLEDATQVLLTHIPPHQALNLRGSRNPRPEGRETARLPSHTGLMDTWWHRTWERCAQYPCELRLAWEPPGFPSQPAAGSLPCKLFPRLLLNVHCVITSHSNLTLQQLRGRVISRLPALPQLTCNVKKRLQEDESKNWALCRPPSWHISNFLTILHKAAVFRDTEPIDTSQARAACRDFLAKPGGHGLKELVPPDTSQAPEPRRGWETRGISSLLLLWQALQTRRSHLALRTNYGCCKQEDTEGWIWLHLLT